MKLVYFASLREIIGTSSEELDLPKSVTNLDELINWLCARDETYANAFQNRTHIRAAINQTHSPLTSSLQGAHEIAFFPPVTGG